MHAHIAFWLGGENGCESCTYEGIRESKIPYWSLYPVYPGAPKCVPPVPVYCLCVVRVVRIKKVQYHVYSLFIRVWVSNGGSFVVHIEC